MADAYLKVKDNGAQGLALVRADVDDVAEDIGIADLENEIERMNVYDAMSGQRKHRGHIQSSNSKWTGIGGGTSSFHVAIPIDDAKMYSIYAGTTANFAFLRSYNPANDETADFSTDPEWTTMHIIATDAQEDGDIPADAKYFYYYFGNVSVDRTPRSLIIDGYDYMLTLSKNLMNRYGPAAMPNARTRLLVFGDSIANGSGNGGVSWVDMIGETRQFASVIKSARPGAPISFVDGRTYALVRTYAALDLSDCDMLVISGGTNDFNNNSELGAIGDGNETHFLGALSIIIESIKSDHPMIKIVLTTPIKSIDNKYYAWNEQNGAGLYLHDYVDAIKHVGSYYSVPVINTNEETGFFPTILSMKNAIQPDGTHPNGTGHAILANYYIKKLATI